LNTCEREGVIKRIFLYRRRRFGKLGKATAAIVEAFPLFRILLDEVTTNNLLVEACRLYIVSEIFHTELETFAYCNHTVTFRFINCVEMMSFFVVIQNLHEICFKMVCHMPRSLINEFYPIFTGPRETLPINPIWGMGRIFKYL
jgi:hypothetical protein